MSFPPQGQVEVAGGGQAAFSDSLAELLQASCSQHGCWTAPNPCLDLSSVCRVILAWQAAARRTSATTRQSCCRRPPAWC